MVAQIKVGVILVNWNGKADTLACVSSLLNSTYPIEQIVVVDNGSTDGSVACFQTAFRSNPAIKLLALGSNTGFTGGNNAGLRYLAEQGCEAFWLLNNDTEVEPDTCGRLVKALTETGSGAVTAKILYHATSPARIWYAGAWRDERTLRCPHRGSQEIDAGQYDAPAYVDFISGCSMMMSREAYEQVGGLDEIFFAYGEDYDWCMRASTKNIKLYYEPGAVVWHKVSGSTSQRNSAGGKTHPIVFYLTNRNYMILFRRYSRSRRQCVSAALRWGSAFVLPVLWNIAQRRITKVDAIVRGFVDGARISSQPRQLPDTRLIQQLSQFL